MKDIAKIANVSETTVSLVLNNKDCRVSEKKKKEILDIAKEINYQPNFLARGLAKKETRIIGMVVPDIENMFFSSLAKELERQLYQDNYFSILVNSNDIQSVELNLIDELVNLGVDGLLIALSTESYMEKKKTHEKLDKLEVPFVLLDRNNPNSNHPQVYFDNFLGGYLATKHLIDKGHSEIGFVKGPDYIETVNDRYLGYVAALEEAGIENRENYTVTGDLKYLSGYAVSDYLLSQKNITGIVVANDLMLMGLLKRASELNIIIPNDLSIVGYDRTKVVKMYPLEITTIEQNIKDLSIKAWKMLNLIINNEVIQNNTITLQPILVEGNSTKNLNLTN